MRPVCAFKPLLLKLRINFNLLAVKVFHARPQIACGHCARVCVWVFADKRCALYVCRYSIYVWAWNRLSKKKNKQNFVVSLFFSWPPKNWFAESTRLTRTHMHSYSHLHSHSQALTTHTRNVKRAEICWLCNRSSRRERHLIKRQRPHKSVLRLQLMWSQSRVVLAQV